MNVEISRIRGVSIDSVKHKFEGEGESAKKTPDSPVGIFDSGVGGLTVYSEFIRQLPGENVIYLADTARVPYGGRPAEEIIKINEEIIGYFIGRGVKMVIMACGTSSSIAYPVLKDKYDIPIIPMIEPGARGAVQATRNGKIGIIATLGTVNSGAFQNAIKDAEVYAVACPLFVPLIEGGFIEADETKKVARDYLKPLIKAGIDTLILGCTHYPHLKKIIGEIVGPNVALIDPAYEAVQDAKKMQRNKGTHGKHEFEVTGSPLHFQDLGSKLLGRPIANVKQLKL